MQLRLRKPRRLKLPNALAANSATLHQSGGFQRAQMLSDRLTGNVGAFSESHNRQATSIRESCDYMQTGFVADCGENLCSLGKRSSRHRLIACHTVIANYLAVDS